MNSTKKSAAAVAEKPHLSARKQIASSIENEMAAFEGEVREMKKWFGKPRFRGITRLYSAAQVVQQRVRLRPIIRLRERQRRNFTIVSGSCTPGGSRSQPSVRTRRGRP